MALTIDILKAQEGLSGLTDEQMQSIVGLSERDEETVINRKYGEMHGQVDTIIAAESAIKRNDGEKSSDYLTRALKQMKSLADEGAGFKSTNETLTAEIAQLKKDIAEGKGNEQLKADLGDGIRIVKVDVDKNAAMSTRYRIRSVPTLILFKRGAMVWRQSGTVGLNDLKAQIDKHR